MRNGQGVKNERRAYRIVLNPLVTQFGGPEVGEIKDDVLILPLVLWGGKPVFRRDKVAQAKNLRDNGCIDMQQKKKKRREIRRSVLKD